MPSKTAKQARFMAAIAHGWRPPGGGGPSRAVAKEFNQADKGSAKLSSAMRVARGYAKKYADGGEVDEGESYDPATENQFAPPAPEPTPVSQEAVQQFKPLGKIEPYHPTNRDVVGSVIAGDSNNPVRQHFAEALVGSRGIGNTGMSMADMTPAGIIFGGEEAQRDAQEGNWLGAGLNATAMIPAAGPAVKGVAQGVAKGVAKELHNIVDIMPQEAAKFQKVGEQAGSNPGGFYRDPTNGIDYYVKMPPSVDHLKNEILAAKLYQLAGVPVADPKITVMGGKPALASPVIHGDPLHSVWHRSADDIHGLSDNFVADAWLGNYDAVGTGKDNVIVDANGQAHRIDMGGALRYRAQGKPKDFGPVVDELRTMKDPKINKDASDVFKNNSFDDEVYRAQQIAKISDDQIRDLVERYGPSDPTTRGQLTANLRLRRDQIAKDYGVGPQGTPGVGGGGKPLTVMQINKMKPTNDIIQSLSQNSLEDSFDAKAVTGKQQMNITNILDNVPIDQLKSAYQNLQDPVKQYNLSSWLSDKKLSELNDAVIPSKKFAQEPFIDNEAANNAALANSLYAKHGTDYPSLANEIWKIADKQGVKKANDIVEHLSEHVDQHEIGNILDDISKEVGYDPWHKYQADRAFDQLEAEMKAQAEYEAAQDFHLKNEWALAQGAPLVDESISTHIRSQLKPIDWRKYKLPEHEPVSGGELKNAPIDRIKGMGFNPDVKLWHGGNQPNYYEQFHDPKKLKNMERAIFMSDQYHIANEYTGYGGKALPYIARHPGEGKAVEVNWKDLNHGSVHFSGHTMHNLIEEGHRQGIEMIVVRNMDDPIGGMQNQYLFLNPALIRGPNAKFDVDKMHLAKPLAGLAGGGIFTYGAVQGDKKKGEGMNRGGPTKKAAGGSAGSMSNENWMLRAASRNLHQQGMIKSVIPGRTDKLPMSVPAGAYVLPADIPSALGQGNSVAGGKILKSMFSAGPMSMKANIRMGGGRRGRMPSARPISPRQPKGPGGFGPNYYEEGGETKDDGDQHVPIIAAGGEFIIHPDVVRDIGHGDMGKGHKVLDQFVLHTRKEHIKTLQGLKPPKKN